MHNRISVAQIPILPYKIVLFKYTLNFIRNYINNYFINLEINSNNRVWTASTRKIFLDNKAFFIIKNLYIIKMSMYLIYKSHKWAIFS